jgi:hypothetical protein
VKRVHRAVPLQRLFTVNQFVLPPTSLKLMTSYHTPYVTSSLTLWVCLSWIGLAFVKVKVILRPTVSRSIRLGVRHPSGNRDQFFPFSLWLFLIEFRVCWCGGALSEEKSGLYFSVFAGTHEHSLLSLFLRLPNLEGQVPVFISPSNRVAQLYPRALGLAFDKCA